MRANLPAVIRGTALTVKSVPPHPKSEHAQLLELRSDYTSATMRKYDENEWLRAINLQRYACLIYGSPRSLPKPGQKLVVVA